jgi:Tol biopolymer transport system component
LTQPAEAPLAGTTTTRPNPPRGVVQRRLTYTADRKFPGLQGPRHWLRCSPDGSRIAFLMKDDTGIVQLWTISPNGGTPAQRSNNPWPIASAFTWSPDGRHLTYVMDNSVFLTDVTTGQSQRLTERTSDETAPLAEACVFSPDGKQIAFMRRINTDGHRFSQICVATLKKDRSPE